LEALKASLQPDFQEIEIPYVNESYSL